MTTKVHVQFTSGRAIEIGAPPDVAGETPEQTASRMAEACAAGAIFVAINGHLIPVQNLESVKFT